MIGYVQAFSVAVDERLEQRLVVGDGLQYVSIAGHIADGPLSQACAAESEDVTVGGMEGGQNQHFTAVLGQEKLTNGTVFKIQSSLLKISPFSFEGAARGR